MYAPEHALKGGYLYDEWDQDLVRDLVDGMTPRSARLDLQTRAYDTLTERIQQVKDIKTVFIAANTTCTPRARINMRASRSPQCLHQPCADLPAQKLRAWCIALSE